MRLKFYFFLLLLLPPRTEANPLRGLFQGSQGGSLEWEGQFGFPEEEGSDPTTDQKVSLNVPFSKKPESQWFASVGGSRLDTGLDQFSVGENDVAVKGQLDEATAGLGYTVRFQSESSLSIFASYGSKGDEPFEDARDTMINATGVYSFEKKGNGQWILLLNYSNNRTFLNNIPLPAVIYMYRPTGRFSAIFGLPFLSLSWRDSLKYNINLSLSPAGASLDTGFSVVGPLQLFLNSSYEADSFMHANREDKDHRLYVGGGQVSIGIRSPVSRFLSLTMAGGFAFDRSLYEGESVFEPLGARTRLENEAFFKTKATIRF